MHENEYLYISVDKITSKLRLPYLISNKGFFGKYKIIIKEEHVLNGT